MDGGDDGGCGWWVVCYRVLRIMGWVLRGVLAVGEEGMGRGWKLMHVCVCAGIWEGAGRERGGIEVVVQ